MGDTYMSTKSSGNDYPPDDTAQSSQLYKALLQQSMQQPQAPGIGGIFGSMINTFLGGQMNPNQQGTWAYKNALGSNIGSGLNSDIANELKV